MATLILSMLIFTNYTGAIKESNMEYDEKSFIVDSLDEYTHNVLIEFGTSISCIHCPEVSDYLNSISESNEDAYIVTLNADEPPARGRVYDELPNNPSCALPCVWYDGGFKTIIGNQGYISPYQNNLTECGEREVADIDLKLSLTWEDKKIGVKVKVTNNEQSTYNGHIHAYITEIESRWSYPNGNSFHYAMLDYAINEGFTVLRNDKKEFSKEWDANEKGFSDITQDNIMVIVSVFSSQNQFADETIALKATEIEINNPPNKPNSPVPSNREKEVNQEITLEWDCSDPDGDYLTYDIYFGTSQNPAVISSNQTGKSFNPGKLESRETYYWKIKAWDSDENSNTGDIWSFTVRKDIPPPPPQEKKLDITIKEGLRIGGLGLNFRKIGLNIENSCEKSAEYDISVNTKIGLIKINQEKNGTIKSKENRDMQINGLTGFGIIEIRASIYIKEDDVYAEDTKQALIIGPFIFIL
jgi:hypothetical protein